MEPFLNFKFLSLQTSCDDMQHHHHYRPMAHTTTASLILFMLLFQTILAHAVVDQPLAYNPTPCKARNSCHKGFCSPIYEKRYRQSTQPCREARFHLETEGRSSIIRHGNNHVRGFSSLSLSTDGWRYDGSNTTDGDARDGLEAVMVEEV